MDLIDSVVKIEEELKAREASVVVKETELSEEEKRLTKFEKELLKKEKELNQFKKEIDSVASVVLNEEDKDKRIEILKKLETDRVIQEQIIREKETKLKDWEIDLTAKEKRVVGEDTRVFEREKEYKAKIEAEFWEAVRKQLPK